MTGTAVRVAHVTTVHQPFDVRIFLKQCVTLAEAGLDVFLIQQGEKAETVRGVKIAPIPTYRRRILRMTAGVWKATLAALRADARVVHIHDPELIWGGLILKLAGRQVIYDVHEDVLADLEDKHYLPQWILPFIRVGVRCLEWVAERSFDRISAATSAIWAKFDPRSTVLIRNTPILGEFSADNPRRFTQRPNHVGYLGGLAALNGPSQMVQAIGLVPEELGAKLILGGRFPDPSVERQVRALPAWEHVDYLGWVDRARMSEILGTLRCGLVVYQPTPNVMTAEPNKFFEFLSAGIPLVASDYPIWRAVIEEFECGVLVDPTEPESIAAGITRLLSDPETAQAMGERGRTAVQESYNWTVDGSRLVQTYQQLVRDGRGSR